MAMTDVQVLEPNHEATQERFAFGKNWKRFLASVDDERVGIAQTQMAELLGTDQLQGKTFLDIGSGSGLHSLVASRMGASVRSFDYDVDSVECTRQMRQARAPESDWTIEQGSILDESLPERLGTFDIVYSWGVLHHTGQMWKALENSIRMVAPGGTYFIAIYNDQGGTSRRWKAIKRAYVRSPKAAKFAITFAVGLWFEVRAMLARLARFEDPLPFRHWAAHKRMRGMSKWTDLVDWVGGYPFEVAKPEEIFRFAQERGFALTNLTTCGGGHGCNQFVFRKV